MLSEFVKEGAMWPLKKQKNPAHGCVAAFAVLGRNFLSRLFVIMRHLYSLSMQVTQSSVKITTPLWPIKGVCAEFLSGGLVACMGHR